MIGKGPYIETPFLKNGVVPLVPWYYIEVDSGFLVPGQTHTLVPMVPFGVTNVN